MLLSRPSMPKAEATRYATVLNEVAKAHDFDPLMAVAIVHHETRWLPSLISEDGEDYGLGQVRGRFLSACREDADPVGAPSDACKAAKQALLDGATNLRHVGAVIAANRDLCKEKNKRGTVKAAEWLAGYQGYNHPDKNVFCKPGPKTWTVLGYHQELVDRYFPKASTMGGPKGGPPKPPRADVSKRDRRLDAKRPAPKAPSPKASTPKAPSPKAPLAKGPPGQASKRRAAK